MKKQWLLSLLLALCLVLSLGAAAWAEAQIDPVSDYASLLSDTDRQSLSTRAAQLSDRYDFGIFVVVVDDYRAYVNGSIEDFAEAIFHTYGLGRGENEEGVLLAMSMRERDYDIYAHGDFGNYAFTDYGKEQLANSFLDNFRRNDWAGGFRDFIDTSGELLQRAKDGNPVDIWIPDQAGTTQGFSPMKLLVSLLVGCLTGGVTVGGMKKQMKTAVKQTRAGNYVAQGGVKLRTRRDDFVNRSVSRQVIRRQDGGSRPSGGHYGGTTISGGHGGSHHSGKF